MSHKKYYCFFAFLFFILLFSCHDKDLFDKDIYRIYVTGTYPVDTLEQDHPWTLLKRQTLSVTPDMKKVDIYRVYIFNSNPYTSDRTELLAEQPISTDSTVTMTYDMAINQGYLYAVFAARDGRFFCMPFESYKEAIKLSDGPTSIYSTLDTYPSQTYTYLFESSFPVPDDFDYNDVVLRISHSAPGHDFLQLTVTLSAAGCNSQVAAAVHLTGIDYDQVSEISVSGGQPMDDGYPFMRMKIKNETPLARGRNGEAVLCLFEDAHWALRPELEELGTIMHKPYNTELFNGEDSVASMPSITRTYNIFLKGQYDARSFMLGDLDPFIIESTNGVNLEVHTYKFKFEETLWQYMPDDDKLAYDDYLAWALVIPDGKFEYPVELVPLGTYRNGELYGAYGVFMHSFGQWARNYKVAYDWWQYPNNALVYHSEYE
jgi:LruC domain-containing protein